jgi:hypothetical protein
VYGPDRINNGKWVETQKKPGEVAMQAGEWMNAKDWAEDLRRRILDAEAEHRMVLLRPAHAELLAKCLDGEHIRAQADHLQLVRPMQTKEMADEMAASVDDMVKRLRASNASTQEERREWLHREIVSTIERLSERRQ